MRRTLSFVIAAILLSSSVTVVAQGADKADKQAAYTITEYRKEIFDFNRRTLAGAYKEVGRRGAWDDDAVRFLERLAVYFTYGPAGTAKPASMPKPEELARLGKALLAAGCDDPLVRYGVVVALEDTGQTPEATALLKELLPDLDNSAYPHNRVRAAAARLARLAPNTPAGRDASRIALERLSRLPFVKELGAFERRDWVRELWSHIEQLPNRGAQAEYIERLRGAGGGDAWMLDVLEGRMLIKRAWDSRGYGYADTVTEEGWKGFHNDLAQARDVLTQAWKLRPNMPEAATEMITVSMGAGERLGEDERVWFERAKAAQLDWEPAYAAIREALMPRWGGSHEAVLEIGFEAAKTRRYDTALPWQLGESVRLIAADVGGWAPVLERPGVYDKLIEVAKGYTAFLKPDADSYGYYRALPAALAWRAGKYGEAREFIGELGDQIEPSPFGLVGAQHPAAAIGHAWVMGGPEAPRAESAEAAMRSGDNRSALDQFRALASALSSEARAKPYLDGRIKVLDRRVRYSTGEWVNLQPVGDLVGWRTLEGRWELRPDGSVAATATPSAKRQYLVCDDDFGDRFEISGRAEELPASLLPCVMFTRHQRHEGEVLFGTTGIQLLDRTGNRGLNGGLTGPLEFSVVCDSGVVDVRVNGREWKRLAFVPAGGEGVRVGVGAQGIGVVRFSGLKIRKLPNPAAPGPEGAGQPATGSGK